jgi:hypothetical protein
VFIQTSLYSSVTRNVSVLSLSIPLRLRSFNCQNVAAALNTLTPTPIPETHPIYESNRVADKWQCTQITITEPHTEAYGLRSAEWDLAAAIFFSWTELHTARLTCSRLRFSTANTRIHHWTLSWARHNRLLPSLCVFLRHWNLLTLQVVPPCTSKRARCFGGTYHLNLQGGGVQSSVTPT